MQAESFDQTSSPSLDAAPEAARIATLRLAGWRDLGAVYRIHRACFPQPYPLWRFVFYLLSRQAQVLVVADERHLHGYVIGVTNWLASPPTPVGEIVSLAVLPQHRRRGTARRLMQTILHRLFAGGADRVYLQVAVRNTSAQALYTALGFTTERQLPRYYLDGQDAFLMVLPADGARAVDDTGAPLPS